MDMDGTGGGEELHQGSRYPWKTEAAGGRRKDAAEIRDERELGMKGREKVLSPSCCLQKMIFKVRMTIPMIADTMITIMGSIWIARRSSLS